MNPGVSVGTKFSDALFVASAVIAAGAFVLSGVLLVTANDPMPAIVSAGVGGLFAVIALVRGVVLGRGRRWLSPTDTGFTLTDRRGEFEIADEMVTDLATWAKTVYSNGSPKHVRRTGSFVMAAGEEAVTFPFDYTYPLTRPDPLGAMLDRVLDKVTKRAVEQVRGGGELTGDGWTLTANELTVVRGREEEAVPVADVATVEVADGKVCVWRTGQAEAVVRVAGGSANALVMGRVLLELMPKRDADAAPADGLGRIIFERDSSVTGANFVAGIIMVVIAVVVGLGGCWAIWAGMVSGWGYAIGPGGLFAAVCGFAYIWTNRVNVFRCHAGGIAHATVTGTAKLLYRDCGSFTHSAVRHYHNGVYTGTQTSMAFAPLAGAEGDTINYSANIKNADDELDNLREFVSKELASHMLARLKEGQRVQWTPTATFTPTGLEVIPVGWLGGKKEPVHHPYSSLFGPQVKEGSFYLSAHGSQSWAMKDSCSSPNFFPGFVLLLHVLASSSVAGAAADDSAED